MPKARVKRAINWVIKRIFFEIIPPVAPTSPIANKKLNTTVLINAFGGPSTEACGAFKTDEQLKALLMSHTNTALLFASIVSLSISCMNDATRPIAEPTAINQYSLMESWACFMSLF